MYDYNIIYMGTSGKSRMYECMKRTERKDSNFFFMCDTIYERSLQYHFFNHTWDVNTKMLSTVQT